MVADVYMVNHRSGNPESLVGNYLKRFSGHFESFRIISEDCSFLPHDSYAMVLCEELGSIFHWYKLAISKDINANQAHSSMLDFIRAFDFSLVECIGVKSSWYTDYLILKWETMYENNDFTKAEKEKLINELNEKVWESIPLPTERLQPNSKVIIYGAGSIGERVHKTFHKTRYCEIVLWADENWESLKPYDNSFSICNPENINDTVYDFLLVAVENPVIASEIKIWLIEKGVPVDKIISNAVN